MLRKPLLVRYTMSLRKSSETSPDPAPAAKQEAVLQPLPVAPVGKALLRAFRDGLPAALLAEQYERAVQYVARRGNDLPPELHDLLQVRRCTQPAMRYFSLQSVRASVMQLADTCKPYVLGAWLLTIHWLRSGIGSEGGTGRSRRSAGCRFGSALPLMHRAGIRSPSMAGLGPARPQWAALREVCKTSYLLVVADWLPHINHLDDITSSSP